MSEDDPFDDLDDFDDGDLDVDVDPNPEVDELFTEVRIDDVDDEAVWESLLEGDVSAGAVGGDGVGGGDDEDVAPIDADGEGTIVPKASFCQKCEHFSPPPQLSCDNPGTDIEELVDVDHFRVTDCPVVERRRSATRNIGDEE